MGDVGHWLRSIGLGEYAGMFEQNAIEWRHLAGLDHATLKEIGVAAVGHRMTILGAIPGTGAPDAPSGEAERRQLTVMFCDLVGSTALSGRMDPEEYREVLAAYQSAAASAIRPYDGYIARYMGDGLLVYFGYPRAHEEDPERAVRAGLDIVAAVSGLRPRDDVDLRVRIGVATGLVVAGDIVGEGASEERAVLGDTPNLAARLQAIAEPGTVVIADATRRLVEGRILLEALEPRALEGIDGPVVPYRAVAVGEASRFEAAAARGLSAMAGREGELALLQALWSQSQDGHGRAVLLGGEPGIGKSRVARELRERIGEQASTVLQYQCSPYHTGSAFHPVIEHLQRAAGFTRDDPARADKLAAFVARTLPDAPEAAALLAALLSVEADPPAPLDMTPQKRRVETIRLLAELVERFAAGGPVLMVVEDAHWIDPSTQELLDAVIAGIASLRVLCLVTHRPGYTPQWNGFGHVTFHSLGRLPGDEVRSIVASVTGGRTLPEEVYAQILDRTDGVPLFVEELTKTILEAGMFEESGGRYVLAGPSPALTIPATLRDSLIARLDRLEPVKEVAQTAACIGREFTPELLAAVSPLERPALDDALAQLVDAELVVRAREGEIESYSFNHALVQDAAYESLLVRRRREVHARIARAIEERFPETAGAEPERLAQHYAAAGMEGASIPFLLAAGRRALAGSNLAEALAHLAKALESTAHVEDAAERAEQELEVRTALGTATMAVHGWPAPEMRAVVEPACDLFERGHGTSDAFMNLWNLWLHHGCRAEHREGLDVVHAHMADACLRLGRTAEALEMAGRAVEEIESTGERMVAEEIYRIAGLMALADGGDPARAMGLFERSLEHARAHGTRSFELRTAMCVARLWDGQGRREDARGLLAPIHDAFEEGFDTADLREAKALVESLS